MYAAVVLVGGAAGFWGYQHWAHDSQSLRIAVTTIPSPAAIAPAVPGSAPTPATAPEAAPASSPASTPAAKADDQAIPEEVPDLRLPDLEGQPHALRQNGGRPRIYNFWASWCEPCRREIPLLNALQARYGHSDRLEIIGVAVDFRDAVNDFLKKTRVNYTSLVGEDEGLEAAQSFGVQMALPFSVFADEHNHIVAVKG
jgi:thiol-disulfide isomerase/thioredoxin